MRRKDGKRRLLLLDGHGCHLTARFTACCIDKKIDLTVIPLYTSHLLQPLDMSISSPLIRAFSAEIEKLFRLDNVTVGEFGQYGISATPQAGS
jgi:hypothetical protein